MRPNQFADKMKMKMVAKIPECSLGQVRSNDSGEELVQCLDQPFQKVLRSSRNLSHIPSCNLSKCDEAESDDPTDQHGIGDWES